MKNALFNQMSQPHNENFRCKQQWIQVTLFFVFRKCPHGYKNHGLHLPSDDVFLNII